LFFVQLPVLHVLGIGSSWKRSLTDPHLLRTSP
jgi:hypothetical protein